MRGLVSLLALAVANIVSASDSCSLSQDHHDAVKARVLAMVPGGAATQTGDLRWIGSDALTFFSYGGCEDLGSAVWRTQKIVAPLQEESVLATALQLAERFWTSDIIGSESLALIAIREGLKAKSWTIERAGELTYYRFTHPHFVELDITHSYEDGWDTVGVEWQGNF